MTTPETHGLPGDMPRGHEGGELPDSPGASPGTALIAGATTIWLVMLFVNPGPPIDLLELAYLLVIPGLAFTRAAGLRTSAASLSLAVALSVGILGMLQAVMIAAGLANELLLRAVIVILVLGALVIDEYIAGSGAAVTLESLAVPEGVVHPRNGEREP